MATPTMDNEEDLMDLDELTVADTSHPSLIALAHENPADADDTDKEEDGTKRLEVNPPPKPRKISERKRADNAAFDLWIEENQNNLSKGADKFVIDNEKSFQALIKDFENRRIIASPRDYQLELFERAKTQNTIAVLDTGENSASHSLCRSSSLTLQVPAKP